MQQGRCYSRELQYAAGRLVTEPPWAYLGALRCLEPLSSSGKPCLGIASRMGSLWFEGTCMPRHALRPDKILPVSTHRGQEPLQDHRHRYGLPNYSNLLQAVPERTSSSFPCSQQPRQPAPILPQPQDLDTAVHLLPERQTLLPHLTSQAATSHAVTTPWPRRVPLLSTCYRAVHT